VCVGFGVCVGRRVDVAVGVTVSVLVDVSVGVGVAVSVEVAVEVGVAVAVKVDVGIGVVVSVGVSLGAGVDVNVGAAVALPVLVGVAVGDWQKVEIDAGAAPPPEVSSSRVPYSPLVWMLRDCPAFNWKVLEATGEPLSSKVQVPWLIMSPPMLVMTSVPCASGVQLADSERTGAGVGVSVGVGVGD